MRAWKLLALLLLLAPLPALAAAPPILPPEMANTTNDLQRAVWACEAGAQAIAIPAAQQTRFFLGTVEDTAVQAKRPALMLLGRQLFGFGQISNNHGWFNIRFDCGLRPDLMQAASFKFVLLAPVKSTASQPPQPSVATAPNAAKMKWTTQGTFSVQLAHGTSGSGERDFLARCARSSGQAQVILTHTLPGLQPGDFVLVSITDGPDSALYIAETNAGAGPAMPAFTVAASDPLWGWMGKGNFLLINIGSEFVYQVNQSDSAPAVAQFLQLCR